MKQNDKNLVSALEIARNTGPDMPTLTESEFSLLVFRTLAAELQFRPSSGVLREIISSGKLNIFINRELKISLASWEGLLQMVKFQDGGLSLCRLAVAAYCERTARGRGSAFWSVPVSNLTHSTSTRNPRPQPATGQGTEIMPSQAMNP